MAAKKKSIAQLAEVAIQENRGRPKGSKNRKKRAKKGRASSGGIDVGELSLAVATVNRARALLSTAGCGVSKPATMARKARKSAPKPTAPKKRRKRRV